MNSTVLAIAILLGTCAMPVLAVEPPADPGDAVLCVFSDTGLPAENFIDNVAAFTEVRLYFVLYHPAVHPDGINTLEFGWELQPPVNHAASFEFPAGFVVNSDVFGDPHNPLLIFEPVFVDGDHAYLFALRIVFLAEPGTTFLHLVPNQVDTEPPMPGQMRYTVIDLNQAPYFFDKPLYPYSEGFAHDSPVFGFNGQPVATASATWSGVKALFRPDAR